MFGVLLLVFTFPFGSSTGIQDNRITKAKQLLRLTGQVRLEVFIGKEWQGTVDLEEVSSFKWLADRFKVKSLSFAEFDEIRPESAMLYNEDTFTGRTVELFLKNGDDFNLSPPPQRGQYGKYYLRVYGSRTAMIYVVFMHQSNVSKSKGKHFTRERELSVIANRFDTAKLAMGNSYVLPGSSGRLDQVQGQFTSNVIIFKDEV